MKKKILLIVTAVIAAIACAFALAGCSTGSGQESEPRKAYAPTQIYVAVGSDWLGIKGCNPSYDVEYKLDDGEWKEPGERDAWHENSVLLYENLEIASTHTVYARTKAYLDYLESDVYSQQVTLNKGTREEKPQVSINMIGGKTGKIEGYTDEMEVTALHATADGDTVTFEELGYNTVKVRFKENDKYLASAYTELGAYATVFDGGKGTEDDPLRITTFEQLIALSNQERSNLPNDGMPYFRLENDIAFPEEAQSPIKSDLFGINLDGNGKKITGAKIRAGADDGAAIFDDLETVRNLTVENAEVAICFNKFTTYQKEAGILAGSIRSAVNCKVGGTVKFEISDGDEADSYMGLPNCYAGGLAAFVRSATGCSADLNLILPSAPKRGYAYALVCGGLAGELGKADKCSVKLTANGVAYSTFFGGLAGFCGAGEIQNSYAEAIVGLTLCEFPSENGGYCGNDKTSGFGGLIGNVRTSLAVSNSYSCFNCSVNGVKDGFNARVSGLVNTNLYGVTSGAVSAQNCFVDMAVDFDGNGGGEVIVNGAHAAQTDAFCVTFEEITLTNCYYENTLTAKAAGATAVPLSDLRDIDWQKAHLNWDEQVWNFHDFNTEEGKYYPDLK